MAKIINKFYKLLYYYIKLNQDTLHILAAKFYAIAYKFYIKK